MRQKVEILIQKYIIAIIYLQVWAGTLGSLYFSRIMNLPLCSLCLIQRGLMYPLILIIGVGLWKKDRWLPYYVSPFSIAAFAAQQKSHRQSGASRFDCLFSAITLRGSRIFSLGFYHYSPNVIYCFCGYCRRDDYLR